MATTTFDRALETRDRSKGFARRLLDRYIEVKMKQAQLRVNAYLQTLDDEQLTELGYAASDIKDIRRSDSHMPLLV